ncbi:folylpolyglutamate synthase, mitochondrial isoform X2 [Halyomorpha halys]|uniref:folylpolyglutamate synthase, mitochondrial isoform X2 n=1 Tax=Halyomorpha halys TaxID=286706 RepID=UPI0006D50BDA|nr:folylpolyglutamate synthase, mitochondrial isoform X2 [Halyomorpha halys]
MGSHCLKGAIKALNSLQSNANAIQEARNRMLNGTSKQFNNVDTTLKYIKRIGLKLEELEPRVIHISGTKGKGSTAIMTEALLRKAPYKTGLFLSPHITSVRERIMINGIPLSQKVFIEYFWSVFDLLSQNKDDETDMPSYFKFLTIMALKVFISEKVDVAVIEVGIGGELDCTNVFKKTPVVGITSIGLDHTKLLGDTVDKIAWQKAGIMKPGCVAFTVPDQSSSVLQVFQDRAREKECRFEVVPHLSEYPIDHERFNYPQKLNASLAIQLAKAWTIWNNNGSHSSYNRTEINQEKEKVLLNCTTPGRCQVLRENGNNVCYYLDGAHTVESMEVAKQWFQENSSKNAKRILIFNVTGGRSPISLLKMLVECQFSEAIFCTNCISEKEDDLPEDLVSKGTCLEEACNKVKENLNAWKSVGGSNGHAVTSVAEAIFLAKQLSNGQSTGVLFTGSLHLVGSALFLLRPDHDST